MFKTLTAVSFEKAADPPIYYPGLNTTKALLILLVILAHCLPNGMIQYYNYFFEMPLFLAISGYLLKAYSFRFGLGRYLVKVTKRLLIPWGVAVCIYLPLQLNGKSVAEYSVAHILYPFYHLWFIPAYLFGAAISYFVLRRPQFTMPVLIVAALVTCFWYVYFRDNPENVQNQPLFLLGDKRFYAYQVFFVGGFCLRNGLIKIKVPAIHLIVIMSVMFGMVSWCVETNQSNWLVMLPYLFFNIALGLFVLEYIAPLQIWGNRLLEFVNTNSLGLYLFHPIVMMVAYRLLDDPTKAYINMWQGSLVGVVVAAVSVSMVWLMQKNKFISRFLLGNIKGNPL